VPEDRVPEEPLAIRLSLVAAGALGEERVEIEGLRRLSGGASRETWSFDAVTAAGDRTPLVLRRDPPGPRRVGMALEARVLVVAASGGVPVPELLASSEDPGVLGSPFIIMSRIEGETIPRRILREDTLAAIRPELAHQCGSILARLHAIDPDQVEGLEALDQVHQYREALDLLGEPHPAFELAFRWLERNRPPAGPAAIVHGDFRNGNLIIGPDGVRAVLDWELVHRGDAMEDLGWLSVKAWRFGQALPVGGFGTYEQLIEGYEDAGGARVDRAALHWWEVLGSLKWGVMCIMQASRHLTGAVRSVELAAIGRRVCENEWDLLGMLQ
jgi:aminoglycoside phosphotransferase (APT) family kinase protein